jgi:hypothetical protein
VRSLSELHKDLQNLEVQIEGQALSVNQFLAENKLFLADYSELDRIPLHRNFVFYSPQVLLNLLMLQMQMLQSMNLSTT